MGKQKPYEWLALSLELDNYVKRSIKRRRNVYGGKKSAALSNYNIRSFKIAFFGQSGRLSDGVSNSSI